MVSARHSLLSVMLSFSIFKYTCSKFSSIDKSDKNAHLQKIHRQHDEQLKELERKFLQELRNTKKKFSLNSQEIKRYAIKIEKQREMLMKAYSSKASQSNTKRKIQKPKM